MPTLQRKTIDVAGMKISVTTSVATPDEIREFLYRPGGPGDLDLKERAGNVMARAEATAPVGKGPTSGQLKRSFFVRQSREVSGRFESGYEVGNTAPHFIYVIKGTRPHEIVGNPVLVFDWPAIGGVAHFRRVHHPGKNANPFFVDSIRAAV